MFLLEPGQTPYDLRWRMFGIPVRVHPMFWLVGAIMGFDLLVPRPGQEANGLVRFLLWIVCFFVSILVHEMGHVVMGRLCGSEGHIVLYAFGGVAVQHRAIYLRWQRVAISFAGPLAGFMLFAVVAVFYLFLGGTNLPIIGNRLWTLLGVPTTANPVPISQLANDVFRDLMFINLFWGLVNLLPIFPLDGGQISREILDGALPHGRGVMLALNISFVLAALIAVQCLTAAWGQPLFPFLPAFGSYSAVLFGMLVLESFQLMQQQRTRPRRPWDHDY
jgi:Zn-dependent protease